MNILITGGAGFVGSHLCDWYVAGANKVICVDNSPTFTRVEHLRNTGFLTTMTADIAGPEIINTIRNLELDVIIHLAAQVRVDWAKTNPIETWEANVTGTLNLLDVARRYGISKFLFASSSEIYGTAQYLPMNEQHPLGTTSIYGASKIAGDRLCHAYSETYGMDIGILRPFNIYGPRQQNAGVISIFVDRLLKGLPPTIQGDGSQARDYLYVADVVTAYDAMLKARNPGTVNFGTGRGTTVRELAETIISQLGVDLQPLYVGEPANKTANLVADISKAKSLGWRPLIPLSEGIKSYISWYRGG